MIVSEMPPINPIVLRAESGHVSWRTERSHSRHKRGVYIADTAMWAVSTCDRENASFITGMSHSIFSSSNPLSAQCGRAQGRKVKCSCTLGTRTGFSSTIRSQKEKMVNDLNHRTKILGSGPLFRTFKSKKIVLNVRHHFQALAHLRRTGPFQQKRCATNFHLLPSIFRFWSGMSHGDSRLFEP
jgi:hypothetical protein